MKVGDGQLVPAGSIIVRQRGMTFLAGPGTGLGKDYTVFATVTGKVKFEHATKTRSASGSRRPKPPARERLAHDRNEPATTGGAMALHGRRRRRTTP